MSSLSSSPARVSALNGGRPPVEAADEGDDGEEAAISKFDFPAFVSLTERVMGDDESMTVLNGLKLRWREKYGYTSGGSSSAVVGALIEATASPVRTEGCGLEALTPCTLQHNTNPSLLPRVSLRAIEMAAKEAPPVSPPGSAACPQQVAPDVFIGTIKLQWPHAPRADDIAKGFANSTQKTLWYIPLEQRSHCETYNQHD
ncbi:hypothetical protein Salat_0642100 [Sesamum alatum]|uniref:Uncharacterized protein n=1 Tax=Sesamum alatum TaxID=300844 RepID=A0AAE2CUA9_9LAMI|nr:hypothetical protein Salat_0642100 [Sesamum alatum]